MRARQGLIVVLAGLALLALAPPVAGLLNQPFYIDLLRRVMILAIAAVSLDLILGYGGMVSFGHAAYLGIGSYSVAVMAFYGIHGPKGLPRESVDKINAAVRKVLEDPATRKRIEDTGSLVVANTPEQFAQQVESELKVYREVVAKTKIRPD